MTPRSAIVFEAVLVLFAVAVVFYVQWWHTGELEDLTARVEELEAAERDRVKKKPATAGRPKGKVTGS